jgi:hypothetical protein
MMPRRIGDERIADSKKFYFVVTATSVWFCRMSMHGCGVVADDGFAVFIL